MSIEAQAESIGSPVGANPPEGHTKPVYHNVPPMTRLWELLTLERSDLAIAIVYSIGIGLFTLAVPVATQSLVNTVAFGNMLQPLVVLSLLVLFVLALSTLLQIKRTYVVELIQRRVFVRISSTVTQRLANARAEVFNNHHAPELVNRFFDVVTLQKSGAILLIDGLSVAMQTITGMLLLALYHPWLIAFDLILLIAIIIVLLPVGRGAIETAIKESKSKYAVAAWLEEMARFPRTFKTTNGRHYGFQRADGLIRGYLDHRKLHFRILIRQIVGFLGLQAVSLSALLAVGGWLVIDRQLTLGQLIAAELVVALIVAGVAKLGKHLELFYDLLAAIDKVGHLTDLPPERPGSEELPAIMSPAAIEIRNLHSSGPLMDNINLRVAPGARIGFMADRGRGKSTLFEMLYGLRYPEKGSILIDEHDFKEVNKTDLRSQIMLIEDSELFEGTIYDNALCGAKASYSEVREALTTVGLMKDIELLPEGLNTRLTMGTPLLTRRQRLRLMLARVHLAKPRLVLIDETLDRMGTVLQDDPAVAAMFSPKAAWTLMIVSANPVILRRCDEVHELIEGKLTKVVMK